MKLISTTTPSWGICIVRGNLLQFFSDKFCQPPPKIFPGYNEVKILGPKNHSREMITSHYQDARILSPFEQFLKNTAIQTNACVLNTMDTPSEGCRKEVKILGKKLGTGIITTTEQGDVIEVVDDKTKFVSEGRSSRSFLYPCVDPRNWLQNYSSNGHTFPD